MQKLYLQKLAPKILSCVAVLGVAATAFLTVKSTTKAVTLLEKAKEEKGETLTKEEVIKTTWKCYIPAVSVGVATVTCIFGINILNKKNQASMASAYALLSKSYDHYKKSAKDIFGEDADSKIKAQMAKEQYIHADGYSLYSTDLETEEDKILFYDFYSEQYFHSTMAAVLNAQYHVNRNFALRGEVCLNEFYDFLGLECVKGGDTIGWDIDDLIDDGVQWLDFSNEKLALEDGLECVGINFLWSPRPLFPF